MEKDLFIPIKKYFEQFGYICDGEVNDILPKMQQREKEASTGDIKSKRSEFFRWQQQ